MHPAKLSLSFLLAAQLSFICSSVFAEETTTDVRTTEVTSTELPGSETGSASTGSSSANSSTPVSTSNSSPTQASPVVPGLFEKQRIELRDKIKLLEKKGVGIKPYEVAFNEIEESVKRGSTESILDSKILRLQQSVETQLETLGIKENYKPPVDKPFVPPKSRVSAIDKYYDQIAASIKKEWTPKKGLDDDVRVSFTVSADGTISDVILNKKSKGAAAAQERVRKIVAGLVKVAAPPAQSAPLKLVLTDCVKHGVEVDEDSSVEPEFGKYMVELQRRIKRATLNTNIIGLNRLTAQINPCRGRGPCPASRVLSPSPSQCESL
jgi:hypothetical protein